MEQYFEITKDSKRYQQYINYQTKRKEAIEAMSKFMEEHLRKIIFQCLKSHLFHSFSMIVPTGILVPVFSIIRMVCTVASLHQIYQR